MRPLPVEGRPQDYEVNEVNEETPDPRTEFALATVAELAETLLGDLARAGWPWPDDGSAACRPDTPEEAIRAAWAAWARAPGRTEDELDGAWQQVDQLRRAAR